MDRIGLYGINWRQGGPEALARFTLPTEGRVQAVAELARALGVRELVYLATCNRVELLLVAAPGRSIASYRAPIYAARCGDPAPPGEAARALRAWAGEGALEHLLLVAAGLESARVGETDVSAQVRRAYEDARAAQLVGSRLELACEEALRVARRVHASTGVDAGRESLAEIGLDRVRADNH